MSEEKRGVEELLDLIEGTTEIAKDLREHLDDDNRISALEWAQTAMENAPTIMSMINGIGDVDDELKDLDKEELKLVASKSVEMTRAVWELIQELGSSDA